MSSWVNRTVLSGASVDPNGTTSHTCTFTAASSGSLLVAVVAGGVTFTMPSGWTLTQSAINNGATYVFTKTASSGDSSFTTTHNGSNFPIEGVVYEFASGSSIVGTTGSANAQSKTATGPATTGLSGTYTRFSARDWNLGNVAGKFFTSTWTTPSVKDYDVMTDANGTYDGIGLTIAYDDTASGSSFTPSSVISTSGISGTGEGVSFAVNVVAPVTTPTLTATSSPNWFGTTTTASASWSAGDLLIVLGMCENNVTGSGDNITTPTATGLTFSALDTDTLGGTGTHCWGGSWQATAASSGSGNISATTAGGNDRLGIVAIVVAAGTHNGVGAHTRINDTSETASLIVNGPASAILELIGDWGAGAITGHTYTPAGATDRVANTEGSAYTQYSATWINQAAGTTSYGVSVTSSGSQYTKVLVEIKSANAVTTIPLQWIQGINS